MPGHPRRAPRIRRGRKPPLIRSVNHDTVAGMVRGCGHPGPVDPTCRGDTIPGAPLLLEYPNDFDTSVRRLPPGGRIL